eukprot:21104-Heterococcus_DN1.PRE.4
MLSSHKHCLLLHCHDANNKHHPQLRSANMSLSVSLTNTTGVKVQLDMGSPDIAPPDIRNLGQIPAVQAALSDLDKLRAAWSDVVSTQINVSELLPALPDLACIAKDTLTGEQAVRVQLLETVRRVTVCIACRGLVRLVSSACPKDDVAVTMCSSARVEASLGAIAKLSKSNPTPLVHTGFRKAYSSIRDSLIDVITTATSSGSSTPEQWHIYATGHSLGAAVSNSTVIASTALCTADKCTAQRATLLLLLSQVVAITVMCAVLLLAVSSCALATLAATDICRGGIAGRTPPKLTLYNFGSPRVGNGAFVELYSRLNGDSFRIVNNLDIVTSMPRARATRVLDYDHVGRTVVIDHCGIPGNVWIEGESDGTCPIREREATAEQVGFIELIACMTAIVSWTLVLVTHIVGRAFERQRQYNYAAATGRTATVHYANICTDSSAFCMCVYVVLHNCYHLQGELALLTSLLSGDSVTQHLEPYYFLALCSALQVQPPDKFVLNKNDDGTENVRVSSVGANALLTAAAPTTAASTLNCDCYCCAISTFLALYTRTVATILTEEEHNVSTELY